MQGFPYFDPLNQYQSEKNPKTSFDLLSYTGGVFNNVLQVNSPERVATAFGFTGLNCFIPQFGDLSNGYYIPGALPSDGFLKTNHLQNLTASEQCNAPVSGNPNGMILSYPLRSPDGSFFGDGSSGSSREDSLSSSGSDQLVDVECEEQLLGNQSDNATPSSSEPEVVT